MENPLSRFVVDQLVPENRQGGATYALSEESVSPTRTVRDENGILREETVCTLAKSAKFVDNDGNVTDVALRTGRVLSHEIEAARYEQIVIADKIRAGCIPVEACPHTMAFAHYRRGPLVPNPDRIVDCGGRPDGCQHMIQLIESRRRLSRARFESEAQELKKITEVDAKAMMQGVVDAFGEMLHNAQEAKTAGKKGLKGKGEED